MTEYHTIYKGPEGETTQWEDIHRRLGNLPPKAPVWKPEKYSPEQEQAKDQSWVESREQEELSEAEDEFQDDRFLEEYRQRRIRELQQTVKRPRFGTVEEIRAAEFIQKVTEASRGQTQAAAGAAGTVPGAQGSSGDTAGAGQTAQGAVGDGAQAEEETEKAGQWVVVHLYKDGHGPSALMGRCIEQLAEQYPHTKFVKIVSTDCIPKYPDANLPTLLVYHGGSCIKHLVGLPMFGGQNSSSEQVALVLNALGPVCTLGGDDDEACQQEEDARLVKQLVKRVVAAREEGDEDSDFD